MELPIICGSDAGISAALRAPELDREAEITVLLADDFPNYSICGLPLFLSAGVKGALAVNRKMESTLADTFTTESAMNDHKAYYPGATQLHARVTGDLETGRLLGAQLMGAWGAEVSKRLDVFATALFHGRTVDQISDLDLSYTPPLSSPWDPVQMASQAWSVNVNTFITEKQNV